MDKKGIERTLDLENWQKVFFTTYRYPEKMNVGKKPLLVTGIASPEQMVYDLNKIMPQFDVMSFPDHHNFTKKDIEAIRKRAAGRTILTTEKDATRLHGLDNVKVIPIEVEFLDGKSSEFNQIILDYIHKHSRNSVKNQENKE